MKHLRVFNESLNEDEVEELKDFCETSLAYLLDEGFEVVFESRWEMSEIVKYVTLRKEDDLFNWDSVKDHYIPFLQVLEKKYELSDFFTRVGDKDLYVQFYTNKIDNNFSKNNFYYTTLEKVINDDVPVSDRIWTLMVKVKDKI